MKHSVEELLTVLGQLSGMRVTLYDKEFHGIFSAPDNRKEPQFCSWIHQCSDCLSRCLASDLDAKARCCRQKGLYQYRCPFGLREAILPLYCGETVIGYLMAGQSLPQGEEAEQAVYDAVSPYFSCREDIVLLSETLKRLPRHTEEQYLAMGKSLCLLGEWIAEEGMPMDTPMAVEQLVWRYLCKNYGKRVQLTELSMTFHCSIVTLTERFRRAYGKTVMQALNEIRLAHARELLKNTTLSMEEIAWQCGFSDSGYFSKRFHRWQGISPTEWRRKQMNDQGHTVERIK